MLPRLHFQKYKLWKVNSKEHFQNDKKSCVHNSISVNVVDELKQDPFKKNSK